MITPHRFEASEQQVTLLKSGQSTILIVINTGTAELVLAGDRIRLDSATQSVVVTARTRREFRQLYMALYELEKEGKLTAVMPNKNLEGIHAELRITCSAIREKVHGIVVFEVEKVTP